MTLAEDVYYITRDERDAIGLNQLIEVPRQLSAIELQAIETMCERAKTTMGRRTTALACRPIGTSEQPNVLRRPHGLYYVDSYGVVWLLSAEDERPDLDGTDMDFAIATVP